MFTLARKIDFSYKTNMIIAISSLLVACIGWFLTGQFISGIYIGGGVFLTWALSREIDPNHAYSAFLAAGFSLINLFYYEGIQLLVILWILLLMRAVSGITGKEITVIDIFSTLILSIYLSINNKSSVYLIVFILAIIFIIKAKDKITIKLTSIGISLGVIIWQSFFMKYLLINTINYSNVISFFTITTLLISFILFLLLSKEKITDDKGNKIKRSKIFKSQSLYSIAIFMLFLFDQISTNNLVIYLSVIIGVIIYNIGFKLLNRDCSN